MAKRESISLQQRVFFDEVYNTNISLTPLEQKIVTTEVFERLKRISQLGLAYLIYPNARHTRFDHSLGTMYLAGKIAKRLGLSEDDAQYFRLAALLHDTGHGPFSHAFEEYLRERGRIRGHEELTKWVILNSEIKDIISDSGFDSRKIADLSVGDTRDKKLSLLNSLILGVIDVDKMDFLVRDAYYVKGKCGEIEVDELVSSVDKVNENVVVWDYKSLDSLETFFRSKKDMYMSVYYSRKVRATDLMIKAMLNCSYEQIDWSNFKEIEDFELLTDAYILGKMREISRLTSAGDKTNIAVRLYQDLIQRNFLAMMFEEVYLTRNPLLENTIEDVKEGIRNRIENSLDIDRRLVFIDVLRFSSGSTMSFAKANRVDIYLLQNKGVIRAKDTKGSLEKLINTSYEIIRVYIVPEYAKKLRKIREITKDIVENMVENSLEGT